MSITGKPTRILFVCMGNICRSPSAEGIMQHLINTHNLNDAFECDSAGTIAYHAGEPADSRMIKHALRRNYQLSSISRPLIEDDYHNFDHIIGMDSDNMDEIMRRKPTQNCKAKISQITEYCSKENPGYVPDPYYGGDAGFEEVLDILEDACDGLLNELKNGSTS